MVSNTANGKEILNEQKLASEPFPRQIFPSINGINTDMVLDFAENYSWRIDEEV